MLVAGRAAWAGIIFILLTTGISGPRRTMLASEVDLSKELPAAGRQTDVNRMQETLRSKGHYQGKIDGVFGLRTRASIRAYQKAENLPATGELDPKTANKLGVTPEGHDKTGNETTQGKPSPSIQWAEGSRRTSKTSRTRKAVKTAAAAEGIRGERGKTLQAQSENTDR